MSAESEVTFSFPKGKNKHIMLADGCVSNDDCDLLVEECKRYFTTLFVPGITMGGFHPLVKNSMDLGFDARSISERGVDTSNFAYLEERFRTAMYMAVHKYIQEFKELQKLPGLDDTGFRLQRYFRNNGFYRTHCDALPWDSDITMKYQRRVLGIIIYLNDVAVGGETEFPAHGYKAEAKKGRITVFPTSWTHPHSGNTPLSSDKWMISSFITCSPVADHWQEPVFEKNIDDGSSSSESDSAPPDTIENSTEAGNNE